MPAPAMRTTPAEAIAEEVERLEPRLTPDGHELRARPVEFRALPDEEPGTFEAIVSVFGNVDSYGDRMLPTAFDKTLKPAPEGRGLPPLVWSHQWEMPPIGATLAAEPREEGLYIKARLFVGEGEDHPTARMVHAGLSALDGRGVPALREFSFGFRTVRARWVEDAEDPNAVLGEVRELEEVELFEVGPTLVGANPATRLLAVKSRLAHVEARSAQAASSREEKAAITEALMRRRHRHR